MKEGLQSGAKRATVTNRSAEKPFDAYAASSPPHIPQETNEQRFGQLHSHGTAKREQGIIMFSSSSNTFNNIKR